MAMAVTKLLVFSLNPVQTSCRLWKGTFETNHENRQGNSLSGIISSYSDVLNMNGIHPNAHTCSIHTYLLAKICSLS